MTTKRQQRAAEAARGTTSAAASVSRTVFSGAGSLPLRRNRDAVCRESSRAGAFEPETAFAAIGAAFPGSGATSKQFLTTRMKSQPQTRKETPKTTQEKKGTQTTANHNFVSKP